MRFWREVGRLFEMNSGLAVLWSLEENRMFGNMRIVKYDFPSMAELETQHFKRRERRKAMDEFARIRAIEMAKRALKL